MRSSLCVLLGRSVASNPTGNVPQTSGRVREVFCDNDLIL